MEKKKMVGAYSTYEEEKRSLQAFGGGGGKMRERDHLEDPGVDGSIILRWIFRT